MNMDDEQGRRIARMLDAAKDDLTLEQRTKLAEARKLALSRHRTEAAPAPAFVPAWAGAMARVTERRVFGVRYMIPVAALVLGLCGVTYMHNGGVSNDIADIDAGLLTDDLPISAYLDTGFDSWLKRSSR
jgi:hypothetical protein